MTFPLLLRLICMAVSYLSLGSCQEVRSLLQFIGRPPELRLDPVPVHSSAIVTAGRPFLLLLHCRWGTFGLSCSDLYPFIYPAWMALAGVYTHAGIDIRVDAPQAPTPAAKSRTFGGKCDYKLQILQLTERKAYTSQYLNVLTLKITQ